MIEDVTGPHGRFVVRAEANSVAGAKGVHSFNQAVRLVRRFARRREGWTITVRRAEEDPFGEILLRRHVDDRSDAERDVIELANEIRSGSRFTG